MYIRNIDRTIPGGPLLDIEIDADVSNIENFPYPIDITPIDDLSITSTHRLRKLENYLDELEINDIDIRRAIIQQVEETHANIIRFHLIGNE